MNPFLIFVVKKIDVFLIRLEANDLTRYLLFLLFSLMFGGIILKMNILIPLIGDDYTYSHIIGVSGKVESISDLIESQYNHYFNWGGRTVGHTIVQLLLLLKPLYTDIVNTLAYVYLLFLIYIHSVGIIQLKKVYLFLLLNLLCWFFIPAFSETIFWISGSGNYLWCTLFILTFLLPYRLYRGTELTYNKNIIKTISLFVIGVLAGWTNENLGVAVIIMVLLFIWIIKKTYNTIPIWSISGFIGLFIGYLFLIMAPGNYIRLEGHAFKITPFYVYFKFNIITDSMFYSVGFIFILFFILLILMIKFNNIKDYQYQVKMALIFLTGVLISFYAMIFSPELPERANFGSVIFAVIMLGIIISNCNYNIFFIRLIFYALLSYFVFFFVFDFYVSYKDVKSVNKQWLERQVLLHDKSKSVNDTIYIPILKKGITKFSIGDTKYNSAVMSAYYGKNIKVVDN